MKFHFEQKILSFWTKFAQKRYSWSKKKKKEKLTPSLKSIYSNQSWHQISALTDNFEFFHQICPNRVFLAQNRKSEHHIFSAQFCIFKLVQCKYLAQTDNFVFLDQICQKRYFQLKIGKVNITMEFCMFELVYNLGHNILELYNVLVEIRLTTIKTKRGIQYSKLSIRFA